MLMKMLKMNNNLCPKGLDFFCCECNTLKRTKSALDEPGFFSFFVSFFFCKKLVKQNTSKYELADWSQTKFQKKSIGRRP